jgi:hypothetical protein
MEYVLVGLAAGLLMVAPWALWPVWVHLYRHGLDNHNCHRPCCDF